MLGSSIIVLQAGHCIRKRKYWFDSIMNPDVWRWESSGVIFLLAANLLVVMNHPLHCRVQKIKVKATAQRFETSLASSRTFKIGVGRTNIKHDWRFKEAWSLIRLILLGVLESWKTFRKFWMKTQFIYHCLALGSWVVRKVFAYLKNYFTAWFLKRYKSKLKEKNLLTKNHH